MHQGLDSLMRKADQTPWGFCPWHSRFQTFTAPSAGASAFHKNEPLEQALATQSLP